MVLQYDTSEEYDQKFYVDILKIFSVKCYKLLLFKAWASM